MMRPTINDETNFTTYDETNVKPVPGLGFKASCEERGDAILFSAFQGLPGFIVVSLMGGSW